MKANCLRPARQLAGQLQNNIIICLNTTCKMWEPTSSQFLNLIRKCTSADDDCRKKRQKTMQPHLIKMDWVICFAWLIHDNESHVFRCKVCVHAKAKNVFVTGKDCTKPKKDDFAKHKISADHWRLTLLPKHQMDFVTASVTANDHAKSAIITKMQTVLTKAKHCLPTVKNTFMQGSLQDLDGDEVASWIHSFSETGRQCHRVVVVDTCVVTFSVLEICSV